MKWRTAFRARQLLVEIGIRNAVEAAEALTRLGHPTESRQMQRILNGDTKGVTFDSIAALCELTGTLPADLFKLEPREKPVRAKMVKKSSADKASDVDREVTGPVVRSLRKVRAK